MDHGGFRSVLRNPESQRALGMTKGSDSKPRNARRFTSTSYREEPRDVAGHVTALWTAPFASVP